MPRLAAASVLGAFAVLAACRQAGRHDTSAPSAQIASVTAMTAPSPPPVQAPPANDADAGLDADADASVPALPPSRVWSGDNEANSLTSALQARYGLRFDVEREHMMDGGFRGKIHIVPAEPTGADRVHLTYISSVYEHLDTFMRYMGGISPKHRYRVAPLTFKFLISEHRTTPSAYAIDWTVAYNFRGSLLHSKEGVLETLVHEIFHLNDQAHGEWSSRTMSELYAGLRRTCGKNDACYARYAPGTTKVRGGSYYAFHAENDVREYAAELMVRFFRETEATRGGSPPAKAARFKCGAQENRTAWNAFINEFWDGKDPVPGCE